MADEDNDHARVASTILMGAEAAIRETFASLGLRVAITLILRHPDSQIVIGLVDTNTDPMEVVNAAAQAQKIALIMLPKPTHEGSETKQ